MRGEEPTMQIDEDGIQRAVEACVNLSLTSRIPEDGRPYCNVTWDTWGCWDATPANTTAVIPCPWYIGGFDPALNATRQCDSTGEWMFYHQANGTWSNYSACINQDELGWHKVEIYTYVAGYVLSIVTLLVSLVIFFNFRQLHCDRITLHKNLFISYILNGVVWIQYYLETAMKPDVLQSNPIWCQVLHVVTQYFVTSNFFWMFCEGLYLHTIIVVAFLTGKKLIIGCHIIGWGAPLVITAIYTTLRSMSETDSQSCWIHHSVLTWVVFGPIILTMLINVVFLCNIVRVLVTKLRAVNTPDTNQTRKAVRATVILIPLLGLQFVLFPFTPETGTVLDKIVSLSSIIVTSFQGFFVATIFCFFNNEVISVLKRRWGQHQMMRGRSSRSTYYSQTTFSMVETSSHTPNGHKTPDQPY